MRYQLLRGILALLVVGVALSFPQPESARAETLVMDPDEEYIFGSAITFSATLKSDVEVSQARFTFSRPEDAQPISVPANLDASGLLTYEYNTMAYPLRAFSKVTYGFEVTTVGGGTFRSTEKVFVYEDNRFDWDSAQSGFLRVHWYEGDQAFGQALLEVAQLGLQEATTWLPVGIRHEIDIYAYASAQEMRSTMMLAGIQWVAGHADPDLNLIVVSLPPGPEQRMEMERQIPHELMHHLIAQSIGPAEDQLPTWLKEGLASVNEIYPNPYYHTILSQAIEKDSLLAFRDICMNFPADASGAYLAYAQAESFTRYLYEAYGAAGLEALVANYMNHPSLDCLDGITPALGVNLDTLELSWRQSLQGGEPPAPVESDTTWPWVVVLGVVLGVPMLALAGGAIWKAGR